MRGALEDNVASIVEAAAECLGEAPPELAQDIMFEGIHLTGGGALLRGMTQRLADATPFPCTWSTPRSSAWSRAPASASSPSTG